MKTKFTLLILAFICHFTSSASPDFAELRSNLYIVSPTADPVLMDGALTQYDSQFSNDMDGLDARKMSNFSENWGMLRGATTYVIERRKTIGETDSIFFRMWNMRIINYRIELITANLNQPGLTGVIEDNYLHTQSPVNLNGTTFFDFSVTADAASKASNRFRVIFSRLQASTSILPLSITSAKAVRNNKAVNVDWKTVNEVNVKEYEVERSADGIHFSKLATVNANNQSTNIYTCFDASPLFSNNYYRIHSISIGEKSQYSEVLKVNASSSLANLTVYPNPSINNQLNLQFNNQEEGSYEVRLINSFGQSFLNKKINHKGGSNVENIMPSQNIPKGIYRLDIIYPEGKRQVISVVF
ncbi:MAG: T9SS type A sorting domain-containing protein [Ginsengibacter sp.]